MSLFDYENKRCWGCGKKLTLEDKSVFKLNCIKCMVEFDEEAFTGRLPLNMKIKKYLRKTFNFHGVVIQNRNYKKWKVK